MSYDFYLWRLRPAVSASASAIYAAICEGLEPAQLSPLDDEILRSRLDSAFPGWDADADGEVPFHCVFSGSYLSVETWSSTPASVYQWFATFAHENGLTLFDPQVESVEATDVERARALAAAEHARDERARWTRELRELDAKASVGDARAQNELGNRFAFGEGVKQDLSRAFELYELAARAGLTEGMFNLAACYQRGEGVAENLPKAIEWYERAALDDQTFAPFALGEIYMGGCGVARDEVRSAQCFALALENGHPDAAAALRLLRRNDVTEEEKRRLWKYSKHE